MSSQSKIELSPQLLRRLHRIHRQLADLRSQVKRAPIQIKASQARVDQAEAKVEDAKERLKQAKKTADQKQLQLKEREDRIVTLERKLNEAASNVEFTTFQEQIAADRKANEVLSDEVFEVLEQIDEINAQLEGVTKDLESEKSDHEKRVSEIKARQEVAEGDLKRAEAELESSETEIPAVVRSDYDRVVGAKGEDALAPVDEDSCGCCCQTLTTQYVEQLRMSKLTRCPSCHAFLYLPEDRRVK
ncbi:Chromosome partition protein Smc [Rubripirellula amarantea]|uniref:Chromosome partition protein Smc n=1 Tax=Rubripirellula amarantea TaxID=2527999 RepID=A0A5C5WAX3_9BACT|nr:phospholipase [Rubripirellula amarantea]TWT48066.1 Chromosome partition protein Smc [Rubripirellula amarantea]